MSKTRRLFRIHLSTTVILTLLIGTLMLLNFQPRYSIDEDAFNSIPVPSRHKAESEANEVFHSTYGWPKTFAYATVRLDQNSPAATNQPMRYMFIKLAIAINVGFSILLLLAAWYICESSIDRKKPN